MSKIRRFVLVIAIIALITPTKVEAKATGDQEWLDYIDWCCEKFDVPPEIIKSIAFYESSWNPEAVSASGNHIGLMQISKNGFKDVEVLGEAVMTPDTDLLQPFDNIYVGVMVFRYYLDQSESYTEALNRYNGVDSEKPTNYSNKVLALAYELGRGNK